MVMMKCPAINELPPPPLGNTSWPWTNDSAEDGAPLAEQVESGTNVSHLTSHVSLSNVPRISLVMPCFNAANYIEEAIRSVLLQGYPDLEFIVMDGGSTDGTVGIIKQYAPWLAYWASEFDRGQSHAINKGLERATGKLFNWFNADDVMCPGALNVLSELYVEHPESVGVCGAVQVFNERGLLSILMPVAGGKEELGNWSARAFLPQPGALFQCELCKTIGGVSEKLHYVMDIDLMMRLVEHGPIVTTDKVMAKFRSHPGSKTIQGDMAGLVELVAAEFNMGLPHVAERMLKRRMEGYAGGKIDALTDIEIMKIVDRVDYYTVIKYLSYRVIRGMLSWARRRR